MAMAIVVVETTAMAMAKAFCVANAIQQKTVHLSVAQGAVQPRRIKYSRRFLNRVPIHGQASKSCPIAFCQSS